jgi:hypothetical protein
MLVLHQIVARSPDTVSRIIGEEAVIILPELGELKVVNEVGARLWNLVDGQKTVADLVDIICEEYDVDHDRGKQDVLNFLQQMIDKRILIVVK